METVHAAGGTVLMIAHRRGHLLAHRRHRGAVDAVGELVDHHIFAAEDGTVRNGQRMLADRSRRGGTRLDAAVLREHRDQTDVFAAMTVPPVDTGRNRVTVNQNRVVIPIDIRRVITQTILILHTDVKTGGTILNHHVVRKKSGRNIVFDGGAVKFPDQIIGNNVFAAKRRAGLDLHDVLTGDLIHRFLTERGRIDEHIHLLVGFATDGNRRIVDTGGHFLTVDVNRIVVPILVRIGIIQQTVQKNQITICLTCRSSRIGQRYLRCRGDREGQRRQQAGKHAQCQHNSQHTSECFFHTTFLLCTKYKDT